MSSASQLNESHSSCSRKSNFEILSESFVFKLNIRIYPENKNEPLLTVGTSPTKP